MSEKIPLKPGIEFCVTKQGEYAEFVEFQMSTADGYIGSVILYREERLMLSQQLIKAATELLTEECTEEIDFLNAVYNVLDIVLKGRENEL